MTDAMMSLTTLVEKTPDADLLREMIGLAVLPAAGAVAPRTRAGCLGLLPPPSPAALAVVRLPLNTRKRVEKNKDRHNEGEHQARSC